MACRLQRLFGTEGDLADEDFLSAVEDVENQFAMPGGSSPVTPYVPPAPSPRPPGSLEAQFNQRPSNVPRLRPVAGQREQPSGCPGPPGWGAAAPHDELDSDAACLAACMELEGPELPEGARWEKPLRISLGQESPQEQAAPRKLRVEEELVSPKSGGLENRQDPQPTPQAAPTPKLVLRPSTAGAEPPTPLGKPGGLWGSIPTPGRPTPRPFQASLCQPGTSSIAVGQPIPQIPMAQAPRQGCPPPQLPPRLPHNPPALMSCVGPLPMPPKPAPANLQTPVVTNHLVQLVTAASKAPRAAPRGVSAQGKTRRFPGPAGILPQQQAGRLLEEILISAPQTPAHGALAKPRTEGLPSSSLPSEEDFGKGAWLTMKAEMGLDEKDPSCFLRTYSVVMVLRKAALKQLPRNKVPSMAVMIKSLTKTNSDAGAVFRDPTGEMQGTVHRLLLEEQHSELRPGSVLLLRQVGVFSPSHRNHYLNVTPNNLLKIYPPEPEGSALQQEVPALPGLLPDHPTQPHQSVPVPRDWGQLRLGGHSLEESPGGLSLRPLSPRPGQEELVGADGCDVDDLDGLLGELPEDFFSTPAQADCC